MTSGTNKRVNGKVPKSRERNITLAHLSARSIRNREHFIFICHLNFRIFTSCWGKDFVPSQVVKDLGVTFDPNLTCHDHAMYKILLD